MCQHDIDAQNAIDSALQRPAGGNNNPEGIGGKSHKEALDLVIEWTTKKPGGANNPEGNNQHQVKEVKHNNVMNDQTKAIQGNSLDYTLRRLRKEAPELLEKVINGEVTANKAAIEAGFRKKTMTVPADVEGLAKHIKKHLTRNQTLSQDKITAYL